MTQAYLRSWLEAQWAQTPRSFIVPVDGADIACRGWNLDEDALPGLVLVHGFRAHACWWDHIGPSLARTHRVAALDLSGMGDSDRRETYSRVQFGRDILAVAAACGFDPVTIVSHSFGTMGAILAANSAPERVRRLIMIDAGLPLVDEGEHQIPVMPSRTYATKEAAVERFRLIPPGEWPIPEVLDHIARNAVRETAEGWTWKFDPALPVTLNREAYRADLERIAVPVAIVHGDRSEIMTDARVAEAYRLAPHAGSAVAIPACHHHVLVEQPIALVTALLGLLANPRS